MNKLFVGIVAVALLATLTPVFADTIPVEAGPNNEVPQIYLIWSGYDICADDDYFGAGGSRPYIPVGGPLGTQDAQIGGCIVLADDVRFDEYAFTGEQIFFLVAVRDLNGAPDIGYTFFTVNGANEVVCNDISSYFWEWEFCDQIPEKPFAHCGFQPLTDKISECILTVEPNYYGESLVTIYTDDLDPNNDPVENMGISQTWFFNPAIIIDLSTNNGAPSIEFEDGYPGQTVMSLNKLIVTNLAEGGVDLWAFIAADDLTDSNGVAKCPVSNVLDTDKQMEFRCKIGTFEDDNWDYITNKDTSDSCDWHLEWCTLPCPREEIESNPNYDPETFPMSIYTRCLGALPLLYDTEIINWFGLPLECVEPSISIIKNQASAECQFRLTYPVPCIGNFDEGAFHIIVRAV